MNTIKDKKTNNIIFIIINIVLIIYAIISFYPFLWMLFYSLKDNTEIFITNPFGFPQKLRFENYLLPLSSHGYSLPRFFMNSVIVTIATLVITVISCLLFSYATARLKWKFSGVFKTYVSVGLFIPIFVVLIPLLLMVKNLKLNNTYFELIFPYSAIRISFSCIILHGFLRRLPFDLEESAMIDGAGIFTILFKIMIEYIKPAIVTVIILTFIFTWNEFSLALIFISKHANMTLPVGLLAFLESEMEMQMGEIGASLVIASIPSIFLYFILSKKIESSLTTQGGIKG